MNLTYNERSAIPLESANQAFQVLDIFFNVCTRLSKTYEAIRLDYTENPYQQTLHPHSTIQAYLKTKNKEECSRIVGLLTGTQVAHDYPYYLIYDQPCNGIGHAVEQSQPCISLTTEQKWAVTYLELFRHTIEEGELIEPIKHENVFDEASIDAHDAYIRANLAVEKARLESQIHSGKELWPSRENIFPSLVFSPAVEAYIINLSGSGLFNQLYRRLVDMNNYFAGWASGDFDRKGFSGDPRLESRTRFNQLDFNMSFSDNLTLDCQMHCDYYNKGFRIYFHANTQDRKGYIGYVGKKIGA